MPVHVLVYLLLQNCAFISFCRSKTCDENKEAGTVLEMRQFSNNITH